MGQQTWSETLFTATTSGTAITGISTEALIMPDVVIPAGYMTLGKTLRLEMEGQISFAATPGTLTLRIKWGGTGGVVLATSAAVTGANVTNLTWSLYAKIVTRSTGTSGTMMCTGWFISAAIPSPFYFLIPASAPAVATVDTTIAKNLTVSGQFSLTTAAMTGMNQTLEAHN